MILSIIICSYNRASYISDALTSLYHQSAGLNEFEVIIIDNGFSTWLASRAYPRNYYSLQYLENKNNLYVTEWNSRVLQPQRYSPNLYEMSIDYRPDIRYGYEVNYMLYNYLLYFQLKYKQRLGGFEPRL